MRAEQMHLEQVGHDCAVWPGEKGCGWATVGETWEIGPLQSLCALFVCKDIQNQEPLIQCPDLGQGHREGPPPAPPCLWGHSGGGAYESYGGLLGSSLHPSGQAFVVDQCGLLWR